MKYLAKYAVLLVISLAFVQWTSAQKFGFLNSAALLQEMPEVKEAEANLETLQKQLQARGEKMLQEFQASYIELERKNNQGEISPIELEEQTQLLKTKETEIAQFEQNMQRQIMEKREQLLQPILDRVNEALKEVAQEEGYAYIFDASPGNGILLYADQSTDVMDKVKLKLGLP